MKKKVLCLAVILLSIVYTSNAQLYKMGLGARLGNWNNVGAVTFKAFVGEKKAIELIGHFPYHGFIITGLYKYERYLPLADNLDWYVGFGGHAGVWDRYYYDKNKYTSAHSVTIIGLDGIIGLEYKFKMTPISIGLDWKPSLNFNGYNDHVGDAVSLAVRYILK
jgi:hypothetical protein